MSCSTDFKVTNKEYKKLFQKNQIRTQNPLQFMQWPIRGRETERDREGGEREADEEEEPWTLPLNY